MQKHLSVKTQRAGIVHINCQTGHLFWEEENLDPDVLQDLEKYLCKKVSSSKRSGFLTHHPITTLIPFLMKF